MNIAQRRLLRQLQTMSTNDGRIELSTCMGIQGAALESCIDACIRRGWVGDDGFTSDAGRAAIQSRKPKVAA